jgi:hypothetical protein
MSIPVYVYMCALGGQHKQHQTGWITWTTPRHPVQLFAYVQLSSSDALGGSGHRLLVASRHAMRDYFGPFSAWFTSTTSSLFQWIVKWFEELKRVGGCGYLNCERRHG